MSAPPPRACASGSNRQRPDTGRPRRAAERADPVAAMTASTALGGGADSDPSQASAAAVAAALATDLQAGLSSAEAARRLARDGANVLRAVPRPPAWRRLLAQFTDPLVALLLLAAAVALVAWWVEGHAAWPMDALVIGLVVLLNAALGYGQEAKAESAVLALAKMSAATSSVIRDGQTLRIPSAGLVRGDLLLLAEGDAVGADARLLQAAALHVQEASLTGESEAVLKDSATLPAPAALGDRLCMVFQGTAVARGSGRAIVTATGMDTEIGAIATLLDATTPAPTPLQTEIGRLGRRLGLAAVAVAVGVVATILLISPPRSAHELLTVVLLGVSLAVAAVPEGLPALLSVVLAMGVQRMARRHAIVKQLAAVETLGSASVIATDKTGTLTRAQMTLVCTMTASGRSDISGVGYAPEGRAETGGAELAAGPLRDELTAVLEAGSLAGDASLRQTEGGGWEIHGDPTEAAFLVAERKLGLTADRERRYLRSGELPFTSERRMMSTLSVDAEAGTASAQLLCAKGAPGVLLERCTRLRVGRATVALDAALRGRILADVSSLSDAALRTLAVASRRLSPADGAEGAATGEAVSSEMEHGLEYLGTAGIIDPPRTEVAPAIALAQRAGIRVVMITGDHPRTALRIAADLGLAAPNAPVLTGVQIDALDDAALAAAVRTTSVFARVAPRNKLRLVAALQAGGAVVAMTGDGVNDAPALKAADIGIAMGLTGTEVSKQAARMVLADDNFATLVDAVREGRGVFDNIRKFLRYLLSSNLGEVLTVFLGVVGAPLIGLTPGLTADPGAAAGSLVLPLLATQILWINLITDAGPALAMGMDPVDDAVMSRPPRPRNERVIDAPMTAGILIIGVAMALLTLLTVDILLPGGLIEGHESLARARTAGFTVLVLAQLFNCFNARSETASAWHGLFSNRWLWSTVALSVALQVAVVHLHFLNLAFGTVPLTLAQWGLCTAMASGVLVAGELRKGLCRLAHRPHPAAPLA